MMSDEYICLLVWFSVVVTPSQYYVLSIGYQLEQKGDADGEYTRAFTLMYGISAIFAPLGGAVADRFGVGFAQLVATTLTAASLFALLSPSLPLQIPGIAAYSVGRLFIFAMFFSNIGRRLGFTHYGALVGTGALHVGGSVVLQYPLFTAGLEGGRVGRRQRRVRRRGRRRQELCPPCLLGRDPGEGQQDLPPLWGGGGGVPAEIEARTVDCRRGSRWSRWRW